MITIEKIDTTLRAQVRRFVELPFQPYRNDPLWVPSLRVDDTEAQLDRSRYPFYCAEIEKTIRARRLELAALHQTPETAVDMRRDLEHLGGIAYKSHRVYVRQI